MGSEAAFGDNRNVLYLDSGGGYMLSYMFNNSFNCTLKVNGFYCMGLARKVATSYGKTQTNFLANPIYKLYLNMTD